MKVWPPAQSKLSCVPLMKLPEPLQVMVAPSQKSTKLTDVVPVGIWALRERASTVPLRVATSISFLIFLPPLFGSSRLRSRLGGEGRRESLRPRMLPLAGDSV
jgi:hypothetical protein